MAVVVDRPPAGWREISRHIAVIGLAALTTGILVGGIGSRIFMRIAGATGSVIAQGRLTEAGFRVGEVTVGGTIALVLIVGILIGILGGALFAIFSPWLEWAGRGRGVVFGLLLFAVGSATSDVMNPDNRDFFILGNDVVNVVMILALFLAFGAGLDVVYRALDRRVPVPSGGTTVVFGAIAVLGFVVGVPALATTMFTRGGCDCDPPILAGVSTVVAGVATVLWLASGRWSGTRVAARILGYGGVLGALGFGLVRAVADAAEIIG